MRPTIADLQKLVDEFFWRTRPRGKAPMHGAWAEPQNAKFFLMLNLLTKQSTGTHQRKIFVLQWPSGSEIKMQAWSLRQLVTQFGRAARRPHVPREAAMRQLYVAADVPLPGS